MKKACKKTMAALAAIFAATALLVAGTGCVSIYRAVFKLAFDNVGSISSGKSEKTPDDGTQETKFKEEEQ